MVQQNPAEHACDESAETKSEDAQRGLSLGFVFFREERIDIIGGCRGEQAVGEELQALNCIDLQSAVCEGQCEYFEE